ncbi:hypothetical protein MSAN_02137000 [Mycena sanguinolenta]|uniref:Uncharacterized protein n=1 Tax=Mycena sanguinolenta TaxID=230812 RepID=A0A8H6XFS8_9AGAR|nr:hypothetical protein MSAN_02137000 [Mycena sanguinolenta]
MHNVIRISQTHSIISILHSNKHSIHRTHRRGHAQLLDSFPVRRCIQQQHLEFIFHFPPPRGYLAHPSEPHFSPSEHLVQFRELCFSARNRF